jgi:hypothetical protein
MISGAGYRDIRDYLEIVAEQLEPKVIKIKMKGGKTTGVSIFLREMFSNYTFLIFFYEVACL